MNSERRILDAKRAVDMHIGLPNTMLRKGVARSGSPITGITDYNWKLLRVDEGRFLYYCEWVDTDGDGHRLILPHEAVMSLTRAYASIMAQSRSNRSQRAAESRRQKQAAEQEEQEGTGGDGL